MYAFADAHLADWGNGKGSELEEKGIPPTLVAATSTTSTTPLFRVIKDPREGRRQRLIEVAMGRGDGNVNTILYI
jgi:hypothetical protein